MVAKKLKKRKSNKKQNLFTKFFWLAVFVFLFAYLGFANVQLFIQRHHKKDNLSQLTNTFNSLAEEQRKLNFELGATASPEYLDRVAREEFGYKKEGEQVVVVKKNENEPVQEENNKENNLQFFQNIIDWITVKFESLTPK